MNYLEVKDFVRKTLAQQRAEIREKIDGKKKTGHMDVCTTEEADFKTCGWCSLIQAPYNEALSDILAELKE